MWQTVFIARAIKITAFRLIIGEPVTWKWGIKKHCRDRDCSTHRWNAGAAGRHTGGDVPGAYVLTVQGAYLLLWLPARLRQLVALIAVREPVMGKGTSLTRQSEPVMVAMYGACFRSVRGALRYSVHVRRLAKRGSRECHGAHENCVNLVRKVLVFGPPKPCEI